MPSPPSTGTPLGLPPPAPPPPPSPPPRQSPPPPQSSATPRLTPKPTANPTPRRQPPNPKSKPKQTAQDPSAGIASLTLPRSLTTRLAKTALPPKAMLQRTALDALGRSAVVFTSYLSSSANEVARSEGRKGINASDVLRALDSCGYSDFAPRLRAELELFSAGSKRKREAKSNKKLGDGQDRGGAVEAAEAEQDEPAPIVKKARVGTAVDTVDTVNTADNDDDNDDDDDGEEGDEEEDDVEDDAVVVSDDEPEAEDDGPGVDAADREELEGQESHRDESDDGAYSD